MIRFCLLLLLSALALGCAREPYRVDNQFGNAVRQVMTAQRYHQEPADPPPAPLEGLEGVKAEAVLDAYRKDVAKPKETVDNVIRLQVGQ